MNNISNQDLIELKKKYSYKKLEKIIKKINNGYPVQYVIGNVNFYGNTILVNKDVLIPRFETEFLVDLIKNKIDSNFSGNIFEVGSGSGCISISLAKIFNKSNITSIDISSKAIKVANANKNNNKVTNVTFIKKDIFKDINLNNYDILVSNPPYVSYDAEVGLETKYEPQNAIFAKNNGLIFYEEILKKISLSNKRIKKIFFEIGMNQKKDLIELKEKYLKDYKIEIYKDLANKDRYVYIHE